MKYILIDHIKVQNANAIAGFTWGFPAITHFLGFAHSLSIKLKKHQMKDQEQFKDIYFNGCAVICHEHQVHTFRPVKRVEKPKGSGKFVEVFEDIHFTQSRNPPYMHGLENSKKAETAPVIEEGKMNMTVSLLLGCEGNIGNQAENFIAWINRQCLLQRLAGGSILSISGIDIYGDDTDSLRQIKFNLLPGFVLMDRSEDLENRYNSLLEKDANTELLNAWLDFLVLKQKARPKSDLISNHLNNLVKIDPNNSQYVNLLSVWDKHLGTPYEEGKIPVELTDHFNELEDTNKNKALLEQWQSYCKPTQNTDAEWEYVPKPATGYLVPIMTGYKAISKEYKNCEVENTRDNQTDVCFVESVHGVGEWKSVHRLRNPEDLRDCLWRYHYEKNWYLCKQGTKIDAVSAEPVGLQSTPDEYEEDLT